MCQFSICFRYNWVKIKYVQRKNYLRSCEAKISSKFVKQNISHFNLRFSQLCFTLVISNLLWSADKLLR